jgi:hypothetical protein
VMGRRPWLSILKFSQLFAQAEGCVQFHIILSKGLKPLKTVRFRVRVVDRKRSGSYVFGSAPGSGALYFNL